MDWKKKLAECVRQAMNERPLGPWPKAICIEYPLTQDEVDSTLKTIKEGESFLS